ncbi:Alpha beta-hydrolase [Rhizoctonia solani]|uniref:Alpha beta-hydrolase n=1 Tax=Rhizoctonia solani TaxID=456999 RepID=A0A8H7I7P6_9AGAM|nr:Alpha beta-hydrolase [Rhizoctonia solani]
MSKLLFLAGLAATATCVLADVVPGEKVIINAPGQPDIDDGISETGEREPFNPKRFRKRKTQCFAWDRSYDPWMENLLDIKLISMGGSKSGSKADYSVRTWMAWPLVDMVQSDRGIPVSRLPPPIPCVSSHPSLTHHSAHIQDDYHLLVPICEASAGHPTLAIPKTPARSQITSMTLYAFSKPQMSPRLCVSDTIGRRYLLGSRRQRPDLFEAVAGASFRFIVSPANGPFVPTENLLGYFPKLAYQLYFGKKTKEAYEELEKDIRKTLRSDNFLDAYEEAGDKLEERIPFFNKVEEDYLVKVYKVQGFKNSLSFYTHGTKYRSWEFAHNQGNHTIPQPALFINPTEDTVADWAKVSEVVGSAKFVPQLETVSLQTSHWPQLEKPEEFNAALRAWLQKLPPVGSVDYTTPKKKNPNVPRERLSIWTTRSNHVRRLMKNFDQNHSDLAPPVKYHHAINFKRQLRGEHRLVMWLTFDVQTELGLYPPSLPPSSRSILYSQPPLDIIPIPLHPPPSPSPSSKAGLIASTAHHED